MQKLIFATNNQHKVDEIRASLTHDFEIISLKDAGIEIDIPEPHDTLEKNAAEKSSFIYRLLKANCFGEDTGLEVDALNGEPGVKSARYAGEGKSFKENIAKLLMNLSGKSNRLAQLRTIISLIFNGNEHIFEGICKGTIIAYRRGVNGFGYDPIFVPEGANLTFGEMNIDQKLMFSHRHKAVIKLVEFLKKDRNNL